MAENKLINLVIHTHTHMHTHSMAWHGMKPCTCCYYRCCCRRFESILDVKKNFETKFFFILALGSGYLMCHTFNVAFMNDK